jgi:hypothetical protein
MACIQLSILLLRFDLERRTIKVMGQKKYKVPHETEIFRKYTAVTFVKKAFHHAEK